MDRLKSHVGVAALNIGKPSSVRLRLAIAACLLVTVTGCGGSSTPADPAVSSSAAPGGYTGEASVSEPASPRIMAPGKYTFTASGGGTGTLQVPAPGPAQDLEELRAITQAPPVTYLAVSVDNRKGTEFINMYGVSIFTPEGKELKYKEARS